jgi:predicted SnoaL-like aldol condensation-catalyzing enzyme
MSEKENLNLAAIAFGNVFNVHDLKSIDKYWAESYIQHNPLIESGREPFKEFVKGWINAMPDLKWEPVLPPVASGDQVWAFGRYTGTFKNDWLGLKANNKKVSFTAVDIVRVEKDKLVEHWDVMDLKTMFEQMSNK